MSRTHARMRKAYYGILQLLEHGIREPNFEQLEAFGIREEGATRIIKFGDSFLLEYYDQVLVIRKGRCLLLPRSEINKSAEIKGIQFSIRGNIEHAINQ